MSTAIVIDRREVEGMLEYLFTLKNNIFGPDIEYFGAKVQHIIENELDRLKKFVIDLSHAHQFRFKPPRLFGICDYYRGVFVLKKRDISIELLVKKEQVEAFPLIEELFVFDRCLDDDVLRYIIRTNENNVKTLAKGTINDRSSLIKACHGIIIACMMLSCIGMIASYILFKGTLLGFIMFFASAILLYECYIVRKEHIDKLKRVKY